MIYNDILSYNIAYSTRLCHHILLSAFKILSYTVLSYYYHIMGFDLGIGPGTPALCRRVAEHLTSRASVGAVLSDPIGVEKKEP